MNIREAVTTIVCIIVLFILVGLLFVVKGKLDAKNNTTKTEETNKTTIVIRYDMNGGTGSITSSTIEKGTTIALPTPAREGYKFAGWYINGKEVDEYTRFDENTTIVAKWILIGPTGNSSSGSNSTSNGNSNQTQNNSGKSTFVVSFDSKGGTRIGSITCNCNNTPLNLPQDPDREGYEFTGWVDKNDKKVGNGSILKCEDITLYATWKVAEETPVNPNEGRKFTVYFNTGENSGVSVDPVELVCGKVLLDLKELETIEGPNIIQRFLGWYDSKGNKVSNGSSLECKDQTLYARWSTLYIKKTPVPQQ